MVLLMDTKLSGECAASIVMVAVSSGIHTCCKRDLLAGWGNKTRLGPMRILGRKSEKDQADPHIFCTPFPLARTWFNNTQTSMDFLHNLPT